MGCWQEVSKVLFEFPRRWNLKLPFQAIYYALYYRHVSTLQCTLEQSSDIWVHVYKKCRGGPGKVLYNWFQRFLPRTCFQVLPTKPSRPPLAEQLRQKFEEATKQAGTKYGPPERHPVGNICTDSTKWRGSLVSANQSEPPIAILLYLLVSV